MARYTVSARKYRPQYFSEVKGQTHIVDGLRNAVKQNKIANAYLFCGLKGTGKTTLARLMARAINCQDPTEEGEPCGTCSSCAEPNPLNIHELDAASHNSAEDMRHIVEQIRYHPPGGGKTVILIDEAHILSKAALTVLLKPLEETPEHVVFILITTEKKEVLNTTISSRCQVHQFRPIPRATITDHLFQVAGKEGVTCEREAVELISEQAQGSIRDALSLFDLIVIFSGGNQLTLEDVYQHLHFLNHKIYTTLTDHLFSGEVGEALLIYRDGLKRGYDSYQYLYGLTRHMRNLLVAKQPATHGLLPTSSEVATAYIQQSKRIPTPLIYQTLTILHDAYKEYKKHPDPILYSEITLARIGCLQHDAHNPPKAASVGKQQPIARPTPPKEPLKSTATKPKVGEPSPNKVVDKVLNPPPPKETSASFGTPRTASERTTPPQEKKQSIPLQATNTEASFFPTDEAILRQQATNKQRQEKEAPPSSTKEPSQPQPATADTAQTKAHRQSSPPKKTSQVPKWVAKAKENNDLAHLVKALDLVPQ